MLLIVNPASPRARSGEVQAAVERAIGSRGARVRVIETAPGDAFRVEVRREVDRALRSGCRRVIAAGGDGTVSLVAGCLLGRARQDSGVSLGIVPAGTANVLARELGLPLDPAEALELAAFGGHALPLDAMVVSDRTILTQLGVGPDARMIRDTRREEQVRLGRVAYLLSLLRRMRRPRTQRFDLVVDGERRGLRAWQIVVANVGTAGSPPLTWGPGIDPTDGALDVAVIDVRRPADYWTLLWRLASGSHRRDSHTRYFKARREVTIRSRSPVLVQGDGEILGGTPVTVRIAPAAIRARVPRNVRGLEPIVGSPDDPPSAGGPTVADVAPGESPEESTLAEDVDAMLAEHSRTWVLQGVLRHPLDALSALDAAVFLRANALQLGPALDRGLILLSRIMHFGEGWAFVAAVLLVADPHTGWRATLTALPGLWITTLVVNYPLKSVFRRRRPFLAFVKARVLGPRPLDTSLPSGHTAAAFAGALLFGSYSPAWSPLYYVMAVLVGFARVYLGVHYPSDVILGAIAGTVLAAACRALLHAAFPGLR